MRYGCGRTVIISALLSVTLAGSVRANPSLDLGSSSGNSCEQVTISIALTNEPGVEVSATSNDVEYDSTYLTPKEAVIGPAGEEAGKSVTDNVVESGLYRVGVLSLSDLSPIPDGIIAYLTFEISCDAPIGIYELSNSPSCSSPQGDPIDTDGNGGSIEVTTNSTTSSTTTTVTTTVPTTTSTIVTTTSITPTPCKIGISPSSARVASQDTLSFTATVMDGECDLPQLEWSVESSIGSVIEAETGLYTAGVNNTGAEVTDIITVWDKANEMSATAEVTVVVMVDPVPCEVSISPLSASVASEETLTFSAHITQDEGCETPDYEWAVESSINSTIDDSGNYQAGINNTGFEATDTVTVADQANNSSAEATVKVSALETEVITLVFPDTIFSSHWIPLPWLLIILSEHGGFEPSSLLSFDPVGDITPLLMIGSGNIMVAFVLVSPNVQGQYDVLVSTGDTTQTKENGLTVTILPWILEE